jgi:cytochrome c oxidase subunit II
VRRRLSLAALLACAAALVLAGAALAGNGGFAPQTPHSPNAGRINDSYKLIALFTGIILVLVETALIVFVVRYRNRGRPRDAEGPQVRGHTRLELIWTVIPVLILAAIASFVFYKLPGIEDVPKASAGNGRLEVKIEAHQFYWQFTYPSGAISIDELHAPLNRVVSLRIHSQDVDHSWWIPELHGKFDAIPGKTNETWFKADRLGTFRGQCGEFCGIFHAAMNARVVVEPPAAFQRWVSKTAPAQLGKAEWTGSCAKCHGIKGQGDYGPAIAASPILQSRSALERIVRNGQNLPSNPGYMPPVGRGWTDEQLDALFRYVGRKVTSGGGAGGG